MDARSRVRRMSAFPPDYGDDENEVEWSQTMF
jgi:hypothetical protein